MAWTERYVRADADGSGDGTTDANTGATGSWTVAQAQSSYAAGHRVNIKAGSYSVTGGLSWATAGTTTSPVWFRGYKTTIGDMDAAGRGTFMSGTEIPAFSLGSNRNVSTANFLHFSNLDFQSSQTSNAVARATGESTIYVRCRAECTAANVNGRAYELSGVDSGIYASSAIATSTASACVVLGDRGTVINSRITGGIVGYSGSITTSVIGNVFISQAGDAMTFANFTRCVVVGNMIYSPAGDGWKFASGTPTHCIIYGNVFSEVGSYGIENGSGTNTAKIQRINNAFYIPTSGQELGMSDWEQIGAITLTADPFVNAAAGDFNINATAGGGALLRAATVALP